MNEFRRINDEFLASPTDRLLKDWTRRCSDEFLIHELY